QDGAVRLCRGHGGGDRRYRGVLPLAVERGLAEAGRPRGAAGDAAFPGDELAQLCALPGGRGAQRPPALGRVRGAGDAQTAAAGGEIVRSTQYRVRSTERSELPP